MALKQSAEEYIFKKNLLVSFERFLITFTHKPGHDIKIKQWS